MKKILLSFLIALGLLLPTVNNTANAAGHYAKRTVGATMEGYVLFATSGKEDGVITLVEVYNLTTGVTVRSQKAADYNTTVDMHDLPSGGYSVKVYAQYNTLTKQFKL